MKVVGALLGTMSGSMGGMTASHNRGGQYMRQRVVPTNPSSTRQNAVRAYLSAAVQAWRDTLTAAERMSWETYAANTPKTDSLGQPLVLTGQQAYIGAFVPRAQIAITPPATAPTAFNTGEPVATTKSSNASETFAFGITSGSCNQDFGFMNPTPDDGDLLLFIGKPVNPSVNYYRGPFQLATSVPVAASASGGQITTSIAALTIDETLVADQYRAFRFLMAYDDGRTSLAFTKLLTVTDDPV